VSTRDDTDAARRAALEEECLHITRRYLADDAPMRHDMEGHGRHLRSLTLDRESGVAEIVAELVLDDGTPLTERYGIWTYDSPPRLDDPRAAQQAAFMIATGITNL
jgi:hypothetical protein